MDLSGHDHEAYVERAIELAERAGERGDGPYGSVLVRDGDVVMEETNRENTEDDLALHPELTLARRARSRWTLATCRETVMYTSTEPCSMCATGMAYAGLGGVVYSVSGDRAAEVTGGTAGIPCDEVFERLGVDVAVRGGVLEAEGLDVHHEFDG